MNTMPQSTANTVTVSALGTPFAGFWIRVVAAIIDGIILLVPNVLIGMVLGGEVDPQTGQAAGGGLAGLISLLVYFAYYTALQGGKWQATIGKRVLGIHVMRTDGSPITYARAFGRYMASILSGLLLMIGYIMAGLTREKTALHDLIADTRVVYGKR